MASAHLTKKIVSAALAVSVAGIFVAGFYPFAFLTANSAYLRTDGAIGFDGPGIAVATPGEDQLSRWREAPRLILSLVLASSGYYTGDIPQVLSVSTELDENELFLGQWKDEIIIRDIRQHHRREEIQWELSLRAFPDTGEPVRITFDSSEDGTTIFLNGQPALKTRKLVLARFLEGDRPPVFVLGNSPQATDPWSGSFYGFAFGPGTGPAGEDGAVAESAGMKLDNYRIPKRLQPSSREMFTLPSSEYMATMSFIKDIIVNITGFIPFAAILVYWLMAYKTGSRLLAALVTVACGTLLSLFIEVVQVFLITRTSSLTDLFFNSFGTIQGALLMLAFYCPGPHMGGKAPGRRDS